MERRGAWCLGEIKELLGCWKCLFSGLNGGCVGIFLEVIMALTAYFRLVLFLVCVLYFTI